MSIATRFTPLAAVCCAVMIAACAGDGADADSAAGAATPTDSAARGRTIALADVAGTWSVRAVPESGDTTATTYTLKATADTSGWTITYPGGSPIPVRVRVEGDSIISQAGPYDSVRRQGMKVSTTAVTRVNGNTMTGTSVARYQTTGADSVLRLRLSGTRTP
jgi:hypothetical protein